jgi:predicted NBD/HSP70 family sugar kinase
VALHKRQKSGTITRINSGVERDINRSIILNTIRRQQPISRTQISEVTLLNKSTVTHIVGALIKEGLLSEETLTDGAIGRNRVNLSIKLGTHLVGAIAFDAPCTRIAIVDVDGSVKARKEIMTAAAPVEQLVPRVMKELNGLRRTLAKHRFHGVGVSVAGIVHASEYRIAYASNLGWKNVDMKAAFQDHLSGDEIFEVENDAKSAALAERLLGTTPLGAKNIVFVSIGPGIGAGIMVQGRLLDGRAHAAGEIGHMTVVDGGEPCTCGNRGCWELYASERAPIRWFNETSHAAPITTLQPVIDSARSGNTNALKALQLWGQHVGVGVGNVISILDPDVVIIGGSITQVWDIVSTDIHEAAHDWGVFARQRTTTILPTSLKDSPPLLGAAALAIRGIFHEYSMSH